MKPETASYLEKAQTLLAEAEAILGIHLHEVAGRKAYLAAFRAAQTLIVEKTGKTPKPHSGVHTEFLRLTRSDPRVPADLRIFLSQSYNLKVVSDYAIGPGASVTPDIASAAIATGKRFTARIVIPLVDASSLTAPWPPPWPPPGRPLGPAPPMTRRRGPSMTPA